MAGHHIIAVAFELLDTEPELNLWCQPCALPSSVALSYAMTINGQPSGVVRRVVCLDCGGVSDG